MAQQEEDCQQLSFSPSKAFSCSATYKGAPGTLAIDSAGGFTFTENAKNTKGASRACLPSGMFNVQIDNTAILGASHVGSALTIWSCLRKEGTPPSYRLRKTGAFACSSSEHCLKAAQVIRQISCWWGREHSQKIAAVVNPRSGRGRTAKDFHYELLPILRDAAGMTVDVHMTEHRLQATEIAAGLDLNGLDALAVVGGDGTVYEVLQGLLARPDWDSARRLPLLHVPAGTGNGVAASGRIFDRVTAALALCRGKRRGLDVISALQPPSTRLYLVLSLGHGILSNLDTDWESLRWMGDTRFTIGAIMEILSKRQYSARVMYLPYVEGPQGSAEGYQPPPEAAAEAGPAKDSGADLSAFPSGPALPILSSLPSLSFPPEGGALPPGWQEVPCKLFTFFGAFNVSHIAREFIANPTGAIDSGSFDMVYVGDTDVSNAQVSKSLRFLTAMETGAHIALPYVHYQRTAALAFAALPGHPTTMQLDGEIVGDTPVFMELHPQLCSLFVAPDYAAAGSEKRT